MAKRGTARSSPCSLDQRNEWQRHDAGTDDFLEKAGSRRARNRISSQSRRGRRQERVMAA
jgi:hypothetical protein